MMFHHTAVEIACEGPRTENVAFGEGLMLLNAASVAEHLKSTNMKLKFEQYMTNMLDTPCPRNLLRVFPLGSEP